jgi:hypothetical protein
MRIKILLISFLTVFMLSCGAKKPVTNSTTIIKDSTVTETTYRKRDTTITIPGDTLKVKIPFYQLTPEPQTFKSGSQQAKVSLSETDQLTIECITEEVNKILQLIDTFKTHLNTFQNTREVEITKLVKYVPWYVNFLAWVGGGFLAAIILLIIFKFISK